MNGDSSIAPLQGDGAANDGVWSALLSKATRKAKENNATIVLLGQCAPMATCDRADAADIQGVAESNVIPQSAALCSRGIENLGAHARPSLISHPSTHPDSMLFRFSSAARQRDRWTLAFASAPFVSLLSMIVRPADRRQALRQECAAVEIL